MIVYHTYPILPTTKQLTIDDILSGEIANLYPYIPHQNAFVTRTDKIEFLAHPRHDKDLRDKILYKLDQFNTKYANFVNKDLREYYDTFRIPKASGGFRTINSPHEELRKTHEDLKEILVSFGALYHTAAFAYVKGRCPKMAVEKHQKNNSNWCLRTDFMNFFGSCNPNFVYKMISMQYPFNLVCDDEVNRNILKTALSVCFLDNGLPQGTTISPMLTNFIMIPIDYTLRKWLSEHDFVYTRYADDIQVSAYSKFDYHEIVKQIDGTLELFDAPFRIKPEKTKFSSCAGVNYMLGLDYNADHNITVGHKRKKTFKAMVNNFFADWKAGTYWSIDDTQYMKGLQSYYCNIEKEYFDFVIRRLEEKYHLSFYACVKKILKGEV